MLRPLLLQYFLSSSKINSIVFKSLATLQRDRETGQWELFYCPCKPILMFYWRDRIAGKLRQSITIFIVLALALLTKPPQAGLCSSWLVLTWGRVKVRTKFPGPPGAAAFQGGKQAQEVVLSSVLNGRGLPFQVWWELLWRKEGWRWLKVWILGTNPESITSQLWDHREVIQLL